MCVPITYLIHLKCQYHDDSRRLEREAAAVNVWPPSPKAPSRSSYVIIWRLGRATKVYDFIRSADTDRKRSKRSKRRRRSPSTDSSESSSEEERRRKEKRKRRSRKDHSRNKSSRRSRRQDDSEDDERDQRRDRRRRGSTRSPQRERTKSESVEQTPPRSPEEHDDDEWVEKPAAGVIMGPPPVPTVSSSAATASAMTTRAPDQHADDDSDSDVGPQPAPVVETRSNKRVDERQYGGALLRGEGSAMAAFLQEDTNVRIPRRGEIGLTSDEIANFEAVGYVMSGSRHKRMNAVRIRKENQVISAEEKRGILKLQKEERERREAILREEFQELVNEKLKVTESGRRPSKP